MYDYSAEYIEKCAIIDILEYENLNDGIKEAGKGESNQMQLKNRSKCQKSKILSAMYEREHFQF